MIRGLQFEQDVWDFATGKLKETDDMTVAQIAQQVSGGLWQEVVYKHFMDYKDVGIYLYGVCDVICADTIFDIKSVRNYHIGKYSNSFQHPIYFECSNQDKFIYLISDGESVFYEEYNKSPQHTQKLYNSILEFFGWLSINNLVETYLEKWDFKEKEESLNV